MLRERVPKLEGLGIQRHTYSCADTPSASITLEIDKRKHWLVANVVSQFEFPITFPLETIIWQRQLGEQDAAIRILSRENKCGEVRIEDGADDDAYVDVKIDAPGNLAEPKLNYKAEWREFWNKEYIMAMVGPTLPMTPAIYLRATQAAIPAIRLATAAPTQGLRRRTRQRRARRLFPSMEPPKNNE